ncbi:RNA polymerase sigma factor [Sunxiuqinia elliptica]|uniref:RNA polymerase sigma factor (Sigma-70 family) n=1 Tax=Sunxiuqinia elliptica TaxID=655355 RepID=A0A4R6HAV4_9BACT|nr:RNA polymerase sigma factor [Sunxiuqinia elliptica]TDO04765.1 RNA polymerase sigma factor (sigma-70 family) [Sunxiuqinia elliptica]TDO64312.1 RNA polymerase sigma factor (sigma-70 family) [Sunxiuqinia elliptica]
MRKEINADYLLWERLKKGDTSAFNELYGKYADILFSFGMVYSGDKEYVKDCIHDLFFELFKYRKNLSETNSIRNYLFKSLKRKVRSKQKGRLQLIYTAESLEWNDSSADNSGDDPLQDDIQKLAKAIQQLPERQQEALNLRFILELPYSEVASIMDISLESVRTLVYRSVKTLREDLKDNQITVLFYVMRSY